MLFESPLEDITDHSPPLDGSTSIGLPFERARGGLAPVGLQPRRVWNPALRRWRRDRLTQSDDVRVCARQPRTRQRREILFDLEAEFGISDGRIHACKEPK